MVFNVMDFVKCIELFLWHMKRKTQKDRCRQMHLIDAESLLMQMSDSF